MLRFVCSDTGRKSKAYQGRKDKEGKVLPEIADDEIPFDIPENWKWVKEKVGIPYITGASNYRDDGTLIINRWTKSPKAFANKGDILLSCKGTVGKLTILEEEEVHIARQIMGIRPYLVNTLFARYFVDCMLERIKNASKGLIPGIERNDILGLCCPLPPLEEQKRIVDGIESALSEINAIDELQAQYSFDVEVLKSKIIDAGIQGKLTEQLPEDGTAEDLYQHIRNERKKAVKDGKIKKDIELPITEKDDFPFDIPSNWKWAHLGSIASILGGKRIPAGRKLTEENTGHKYIRVSEMKNGTVLTEGLLYVPEDIYPSISQYIINKEDVYITVAGTIGRVGKIPEEIDGANLTENADRIVFSDLNQNWLIYVLSSRVVQRQIELLTTQVAQPKLAIKRIQDFLVPIPPLDEQYRIANVISRTLNVLEENSRAEN